MSRITFEVVNGVARIGLSRAEKRNAFDRAMFDELAAAYTRFEEEPALRCALVFAHGEHFTGGLDLGVIGPEIAAGAELFPPGLVDPLGLGARRRTKPVVMALQGFCLTIGIELALAADVRLCAEGTRFSQIEVQRGIYPFGGATLRFPRLSGYGNAMRWMLTGDFFDAAEAHRIGLVQEVVPMPELHTRGVALAERIAAQAPLAVRATLASTWNGMTAGFEAEAAQLSTRARGLMATADAAEGMRSFLERRPGVFEGK